MLLKKIKIWIFQMFCIKICFFEAGAGRSRDFMGGAKNVHQESKKKLWIIFLLPFTSLKNAIINQTFVKKIDRILYLYIVR